MRNTLHRPLLGLSSILAILLLLVAVPALATTPSETLAVNVPFEFIVNETTLPAGTYWITTADEDEPDTMKITNEKTNQAVFFLTQAIPDTRSHSKSKVTFLEVEGKHLLSEIWIPAHSQGRQVLETMEGDFPETVISGRASDMTDK
jgi:hypothetical protein